MSVKIFVGNVPANSQNDELQGMFEAFGEVTECDIVSNYAFVHMAEEAEAKMAIDSLHQSTFNGSQIRCEMSTKTTQGRKRAREAEDEEPGSFRGDRGDRGGGRGGGARGGRGGRGAPRGGRGGARGGGGAGAGAERYTPYSKPGYGEEEAPTARDPFRDPYIREILLRDPYVRDLIDRELYYRDALTRPDPYEALPPPRRDPFAARRDLYAPEARSRDSLADPYARPPPDYYRRAQQTKGADAENGSYRPLF